MNTETTITLTAENMPLFASKELANGETVTIEADGPEANSFSVTRCYMGMTQWQGDDLTAAEAVEACETWGLGGWTAEA